MADDEIEYNKQTSSAYANKYKPLYQRITRMKWDILFEDEYHNSFKKSFIH